jgi:hypothetical protein
MQIDVVVGWYAASYIGALVVSTVMQKRGHTFFPTAASAAALCMIWPVIVAITLAIYVFLLAGSQWGKVENWWSSPSGTGETK